MAKVQNFSVILGKYNVMGVCTSGNYTQKWITEWYNY